jgi:hypothetical protein
MRITFLMLCAWINCSGTFLANTAETLRLPLSGNGPADAVEWDFQISEGRRAGEQARIPVPSQWEQHGFGNYDYGSVASDQKHKEDGLYQRSFTVPENWRGMKVRIVFDGSMTDTTVTVNGKSAGPTHQGGFYRFHYDLTDMIQYGKSNQLAVLVSKDSANPSVEEAERKADFWVFGGIFRPVWLEARPAQSIEWTALDGKADGTLRAKVNLAGEGPADRLVMRVLTMAGELVGKPLEAKIPAGEPVELEGRITGVLPWSVEDPQLYQVEVCLLAGERVLHRTRERTGFRTLEVRPGQGVFVNGSRLTVKGVNRHCFRPETGRSLNPQDSVEDVRLIKSMNMNAVRCSHYSPDQAFLDACDELGLGVIDELCTWQRPTLDTATARRLVGQLVRRDGNHPSILWWANGNEGGWNRAVDGDYHQWDLQQRPVLHPWDDFSGFQTKHYPRWDRLQRDLAGKSLVMPTEFLHGLFDGGHGAGLEDYWQAITSRPNGVGGFLWVLADEGIVRTDRNGQIDVWGTNAPDGIVGPHHEKEASFLTIKDLFNPVQIAMRQLPPDFSGQIEVANHYSTRKLDTVTFGWWLERFGQAVPAPQPVAAAPVPPGGTGSLALALPAAWREADVLCLRANDQDGLELWTWRWPVKEATADAAASVARRLPAVSSPPLQIAEKGSLSVTAAGTLFGFDQGLLTGIGTPDSMLRLANGPRLVGTEETGEFTVKRRVLESGALHLEATSTGPFEAYAWTVYPNGLIDLEYRYRIDHPTLLHGITFDLPEDEILAFSWVGQGPERVWANRLRGTGFGSFSRPFSKLRPGLDFGYPHTAGYYAEVRSADLRTKAGTLHTILHQSGTYLRVGTNDEGKPVTTTWPAGNFSILHAIPAIGTKFDPPEMLGPQSSPQPAPGVVTGKVTFGFTR